MPESSRIFVVTGDEVVRLALTGSRAHDVQSVLNVTAPRCVAVDPHDPNRVYVGTFDDGLYASDDGGQTWREAWEGVGDRRVMSVAVSRSHQAAGVSAVYAGTEPSNLYRSEDGGKTWQPLPEPRRLESEPRWSFPPRPWTHHVSTIARQARLLRSRGNGWERVDNWGEEAPLRRMLYALAALAEQPGRLLVGLRGGSMLVTGDAGETWSLLAPRLPDEIALAAAPATSTG